MSKQDHAALADAFNRDEPRVDWHDKTLWFVREKRDKAVFKVPEWEWLRETASQIKNNVLSNLSEYLMKFEEQATRNGVVVHWAADGKEHNEIVYGLLKKHGVDRMVKSKS